MGDGILRHHNNKKEAKSKKLLSVSIRLLSDSEMKKLEFSPKIPRKKKVAL